MELQAFIDRLHSHVPVGTVFENPGGGTSTVMGYTGQNVCYMRRDSKIRVSTAELHRAYIEFKGRVVSTSALKQYAPRVFDSSESGHNCNTTFLFQILRALSLAGPVQGGGKRGNPFTTQFKSEFEG